MVEGNRRPDSLREANAQIYAKAQSSGRLDVLTPMARDVLCYRYGAQDNLSLREVGEILGKSSSTIGKIERQGLAALKRTL